MESDTRKGPRHMGLVVDDALTDRPEPTTPGRAPVAQRGPTPTHEAPLRSASLGQSSRAHLPDDSEPSHPTAAPWLEASAPSEPASEAAAPRFVRTGHPVRDRLMAKALEAQRSPGGSRPEQQASSLGEAGLGEAGLGGAGLGELQPSAPSASQGARAHSSTDASRPDAGGSVPPFSTLESLSSDLDEIAAPRGGGAPITLAGTPLSSSAVLALGTVLGLAGLASLFALLIQFAPQDGEPLAQPTPEQPAPTVVVNTPESVPVAPAPPTKRQRVDGPWRIGNPGPGQRKISGEIGQEPFLRALQTAGIPRDQAYRIHTALKSEKNLDRCRPKDQFVALVEGSEKRVVAFEYIVGKEEIYQARQQGDGLLKGAQLDLQVKRERVQGSILVTSGSFAEAAVAAGLEPSLGEVVNRALDGHTSVAQFQRGDRLRVLAQEVTVLGEFSRYAGIEALEYVPVNGKVLRIYYYSQRKKYYDAQGRAPGEGGWRRPVKGAPITSRYNPNRLHPILKKRMPHTGTDFGAPTGTPVYAASYGTLTKLGVYGPNGNFIAIQHDHGYETGYSHLSRFEPGLKVGDKVQRAQVIGYVGSTGRSTGPHLHFSAKKNGAFIDPESLNLDALTVLPPEERAGFAKVRAQYESLLEAVALPPALNEPAPPAPAETHLDLGMEEAPDGVGPGASANAALAAPVSAPPQQAAAAPHPQAAPAVAPTIAAAPAVAPATRPAGGSLYVTDQELLQSQSAFDEGEVEQ